MTWIIPNSPTTVPPNRCSRCGKSFTSWQDPCTCPPKLTVVPNVTTGIDTSTKPLNDAFIKEREAHERTAAELEDLRGAVKELIEAERAVKAARKRLRKLVDA